MDLIRSAAERRTDQVYSTVYATLWLQPYENGFPSIHQLNVDEAQTAQTIDFKHHDQVAAGRDIVSLIAIFLPIDMVSRFISPFSQGRHMSPKEARGPFAFCFQVP